MEIGKHFIKKKLRESLIFTLFVVKTEDQLVDMLTKGIASRSFYHILSKVGMRNIFIPT